MFNYFLLCIAVAFAVINGCILHGFANRDIRNVGDTFFFNGGISAIWIVILAFFSAVSGDFKISAGSMFYGVIYGIIICSFLLFKKSFTNKRSCFAYNTDRKLSFYTYNSFQCYLYEPEYKFYADTRYRNDYSFTCFVHQPQKRRKNFC